MNSRERFHAVMHYQPADRCPMLDLGYGTETLGSWQRQGLPRGTDIEEYFGIDCWRTAPINVGLCPEFSEEVVEDYGDTRLARDGGGVLKLESKFTRSNPRALDHTLKDRESWTKHFQWRLDGTAPERAPADWDVLKREYLDPDRPYTLGLNVGSLYGWLRQWMGLENLTCATYDDPEFFELMVDTIANCVVNAITPALEAGIEFDYARFWENMCYRGGPVLSTPSFRKFLTPGYRKITSLLERHGIDIVVMDCEGDISQYVPLWLDAGINTMSPLEVGPWGGDPVHYRRRYGRDLLMMGGFSKRILAQGPDAITEEIERLAPLVSEGGYIPLPDHRVSPEVRLKDYQHYLAEGRGIWSGCVVSTAELRSGAD